MADAVREKERDRAPLEQRFGRTAQDSESDEAVSNNVRRRAVHVAPFDIWLAGLGRCGESLPNDGVELRLLRRERAGDGICPGDVAGVAAVLAARVDEHEFAGSERPRGRGEVEDCGMAPPATIVSNARKSAPPRKNWLPAPPESDVRSVPQQSTRRARESLSALPPPPCASGPVRRRLWHDAHL